MLPNIISCTPPKMIRGCDVLCEYMRDEKEIKTRLVCRKICDSRDK